MFGLYSFLFWNIGLKSDSLLLSHGFTQFFEANSVIILSHVVVTIDGVLDWMIGFIVPYTLTHSGLQVIQRYR
jgi:hypothetical protein